MTLEIERQLRRDPALRELNELGWSRVLPCHFKGKGTPHVAKISVIYVSVLGGAVPQNRFLSMCLEFLGNYSFIIKFFADADHCSGSSSQSNL